MKSFLLGAVGYPLLELCWRGRTHPTMSLAGGISCWGLDRLRRSRLPAWSMPLVGCGIITGVEATVGLNMGTGIIASGIIGICQAIGVARSASPMPCCGLR